MTDPTQMKSRNKLSSKKVRDDFSEPVKRQLREMCGGICSNPDCKVYTFGPTMEERSGYSNIGVAAHIAAAAPGPGARRYDPTMTSEIRGSATNGVWLCQSCSKLIDTDEVRDAPINLSCSRGKLQFSRHLQRHWTKSDRKIMYGELFRPVLRVKREPHPYP